MPRPQGPKNSGQQKIKCKIFVDGNYIILAEQTEHTLWVYNKEKQENKLRLTDF